MAETIKERLMKNRIVDCEVDSVGLVRLRMLTCGEVEGLLQMDDEKSQAMTMVSLSVVDEQDNRVFPTPQDTCEVPITTLKSLADAIVKTSGLKKTGDEEPAAPAAPAAVATPAPEATA